MLLDLMDLDLHTYISKIHNNLIREHSFTNKTPAEQAGIKIDLGQNKVIMN